jgi:hypothetical protein
MMIQEPTDKMKELVAEIAALVRQHDSLTQHVGPMIDPPQVTERKKVLSRAEQKIDEFRAQALDLGWSDDDTTTYLREHAQVHRLKYWR